MLFENLIRPVLFRLGPETAHEFGLNALRVGLGSKAAQRAFKRRYGGDPFGEIERFGLKFNSPIGVAAGFDKNGVVVNQLAALGFGFVEVGTITYEPQPGNERPRLFRLPEDSALVNRLGFNNEGAVRVAERLKDLPRNCIVGVNIGRNKNVPNEETVENYLKSFELAREVADYIAINVSSPNTPNLRELQQAENLEELLKVLQERNRLLQKPPKGGTLNKKPLLVKIAPDLDTAEIEAIVDICSRHKVSGIIATNTTVKRDGLKTINVSRFGDGGLSGKPLASRSNEVISAVYRFSNGKMPVIGVGGIFTAEDAFEKIAAGACLVQAYTGFVFRGPSFAHQINLGLARILKGKGFANLDEAVGSGSAGTPVSS